MAEKILEGPDEYSDIHMGLWREAMTNLRQLHNDVWNGVRFFLALNAVVFAMQAFLVRDALQQFRVEFAVGMVIVSAIGIYIAALGRWIFSRHRIYYLEMMVKRAFIEKELGFFKMRSFAHWNLSFPWTIDTESLKEIEESPEEWVSKMRYHPKTISGKLYRFYTLVILFHTSFFFATSIILLVKLK